MTKTLQLLIDGVVVCAAEYNDHTMASIHVSSDPYSDKSGLWPLYFHIDGFSWGPNNYSLQWPQGELKEGQKVEIRLAATDGDPTPPQQKLVVDEKNCNFCERPSKSVPWLVDKHPMARICSDCVNVCVEEIKKHAT